jgi:HK97 family phage prohead protease
MKISLRKDSVVIDGYVNAVERFSRPLWDNMIGKFVEKIVAGVFKRALHKAKNVKVLLNHDYERELADTASGKAKLFEDNVGLRAIVEIDDAEVVEKARAGKLVGWSFGFNSLDDERQQGKDGMIERIIKDLQLFEVSIIDNTMLPAYVGTSIEARAIDGKRVEIRVEAAEQEIEQPADDEQADETAEDKEKSETPADGVGDEPKPNDSEQMDEAELSRQRQLRETAING